MTKVIGEFEIKVKEAEMILWSGAFSKAKHNLVNWDVYFINDKGEKIFVHN